MPHRPPELSEFLTRLRAAFDAAALTDPARAALTEIFRRASVPCAATGQPVQVPVCAMLDAALAPARAAGGAMAALADAVAALAPMLAWTTRTAGGANASAGFAAAHANTTILGARGLEPRDDVWLGMSLMAPATRYPDHDHPPEEVYLALTPGAFRHGDSDWCEPGVGGTFHNQPGIAHAMRSGASPFLAIWCLRI